MVHRDMLSIHTRDETLKEISRITGGKFFYLNDVRDVNAMIDEIFNSN